MASPLLNSPTEILLLILAHLSSANLWAICLTSRDLRTLAEPFLYSGIQWTWKVSQTPPIIQLLRTILQRPQLSSLIQSVVLHGEDNFGRNRHHFLNESPKLLVSEMNVHGLVKCVKGLNVPYGDKWIQELNKGTMDAFMALFLSQLPNLGLLHLGKNFTRETRWLGRMLRFALCEEPKDNYLPSFERLHDVSIVYFRLGVDIRGYTDARNTADVLPFFYLASVERITASIDNPATFTWPAAHPPNPSRLTSLNLTMIREGHLGQVLSVARGLNKLRWDWYYRPDLEDSFVTDTFDFDQIAADLFHVRETLTDLTIRAGTDADRAEPEYPRLHMKGCFRAFRDLDMLKYLEVPLPLLMGFSPVESKINLLVEALPENIEWLTITDDLCRQDKWKWEDIDLLKALQLWLQDSKKCTPRIQGFHLLLRVLSYGAWNPVMRQALRDLCAQSDIRVEITKLAGEM